MDRGTSMKYLTPRSKLILALVGAWALVVICRAVPTTPPPALLNVAPTVSLTLTPLRTPTTRQNTRTAVILPVCDTTAYTNTYRDFLNQWSKGATQSELIATVNSITTPTGCGPIQQRIIDRLELATRTGIIATTRREVLAAQKEIRACISGLELLAK
jgi:hypothetical protein